MKRNFFTTTESQVSPVVRNIQHLFWHFSWTGGVFLPPCFTYVNNCYYWHPAHFTGEYCGEFCYFHFVESFFPHDTLGTKRYKTWLGHSWRLYPKFVHLSFLFLSVSSLIQMPKQLHPRSPSCITSHHLFFLLAEHADSKMNSFTSSWVSAVCVHCISKSNTMHARRLVSHIQPHSLVLKWLLISAACTESMNIDAKMHKHASLRLTHAPEQALCWSLTSSLHLPGVSFHAACLCVPEEGRGAHMNVRLCVCRDFFNTERVFSRQHPPPVGTI